MKYILKKFIDLVVWNREIVIQYDIVRVDIFKVL